MDQREFASHFDTWTSTLQLSGSFDYHALPHIEAEVARAHRRTACTLTVAVNAADVSAHTLGRLVHLCHSRFPGTVVRLCTTPVPDAA